MSRHRNIRSMDFSEDYAGYDDVYGHSVEDDYCVSPSDAAFIYDREGSRGQQKISAFFKADEDIAEEDETDVDKDRIDTARATSCLDRVKEVVGITSMSDDEIIALTLKYNYNPEKVIASVLSIIAGGPTNHKSTENRDEKDVNLKIIPQPITNTDSNLAFQAENISLSNLTAHHLKNKKKKFAIPKLFPKSEMSKEKSPESSVCTENKFIVTKLLPKKESDSEDLSSCYQEERNIPKVSSNNSEDSSKHKSLASLVSSHLNQEGTSKTPKLFLKTLPESHLKFTEQNTHNSLASLTESNFKKPGKFTIPTLFPKQSNSQIDKIDSPDLNFYNPTPNITEKTFSTLADLTKNHLKINPVSKIQEKDVTSHSLSLNSSKLDENSDYIYSTSAPCNSYPKNQSEEEDCDWQIDLSQALISSSNPSLLQKPQVADEEEFTLQFIDCDIPTEDMIKLCQVDSTSILFKKFNLQKKVSPFGKVITRAYKTRNFPYNIGITKLSYVAFSSDIMLSSVSRFKFNTPSPDDEILAYLRRK